MLEFIHLPRKAFFQGEGYGFGGVRQQSRAQACGRGHTQNSPQRAATIDYIHWLTPFFSTLCFFQALCSSGQSRNFSKKPVKSRVALLAREQRL
jgi:hypothetical protein